MSVSFALVAIKSDLEASDAIDEATALAGDYEERKVVHVFSLPDLTTELLDKHIQKFKNKLDRRYNA